MLSCKHKTAIAILNNGVTSEFCALFGRTVNDTICSSCVNKQGEMAHPPVEVDFPRRSDEELRVISDTCYGCPLLKDHRCSKMKQELNPPDIAAQHPSKHCPEDLW
jgi:hypothetical protein